jgi:hypothetical protein
MNLAITLNPPLDPFISWQAANGAEYCHRLSSIITQKQCDINYQSVRTFGYWGGCECNKYCRGLHDQNLKQQTNVSSPHIIDNDSIDGLSALDDIIDQLYENPVPDDDFDDIEIDIDDEELLELFPELATKPVHFQRFTEYQIEAPRFAVYRGRCKLCGGYMCNTRERQDDNVFKCVACGWRTSPEYEQNRSIQASYEVKA